MSTKTTKATVTGSPVTASPSKGQAGERPGYKLTKLGWLPESWEVVPFGKAFERVRNGLVPEPDRSYQELGIRSHGLGLFYKDPKTGAQLGNKSVYWVEPDCLIVNIVFAWEQAVARTTLADKGLIASHRFPMYRPREGVADLDYVLYFLKTRRGKRLLEDASPGGAGRNKTLSQGDLSRSLLPLPPLPKQRRIATILATWDQAIANLQQLIAAKQRRKQALMQELLSGRRRFPGFKEKWKEVRLGDAFEFLSTTSYSRAQLTNDPDKGDVAYIHYGDIHATYTSPVLPVEGNAAIPRLLPGISLNGSADFLRAGDLILADASEDTEGIGASIELSEVGDRRVIGGLHTIALRDKSGETVSGFRAYMLREPIVAKRMRVLATGSKVFGLSKTNLATLMLRLPSPAEQAQIVEALQELDSELSYMSDQLTHLTTQKRGIMQQLLMGGYGC